MNLSDHFTIEEFSTSDYAARHDLDNSPPPDVSDNLIRLALLMEQVRQLCGCNPVHVNSAYRAPAVNVGVGGSATSAHCAGLACDFTVPGYGSISKVAQAIAGSSLEFDQLILEYGWVHLGLSMHPPRRELMTKRSAASPYEQGLNA